jgi:Zn-dependent protease with chaperone function
MKARTASFNALLFSTDLAVSLAVAVGLAYLVSPGLPWLAVFGLLEGAYLAFTAYCLLRGTGVILRQIKAFPLDLLPHPKVAEAFKASRGAGTLGPPAFMRTASRSVNALVLGREGEGILVLTDGVLESLGGSETQALLACEMARLRSGDAAIWSAYARLSLAPTIFSRMIGKKKAAGQAFFFGNTVLLAAFWLGLMLQADSPGWSRALLILGMPSLMMVTTFLVNLLASVPLVGLLRTVDWRERVLAADREAAAVPGGAEAMASLFDKVEKEMAQAVTAAFDTSAWTGPVKLRKSYFVDPEAWFQVKGWNPQPGLGERRKALGFTAGKKP